MVYLAIAAIGLMVLVIYAADRFICPKEVITHEAEGDSGDLGYQDDVQ